MQRHLVKPRDGWKQKLESLGFGFHTTNIPYWDETACYSFEMDEVLFLEQQSLELWQMCLDAVQYVIDRRLYEQFHIPAFIVPYIEKSWNEDHPSIYSRFDFSYQNGSLKLLEINADTPTSLFEMAVVQWYWLQDVYPEKDQFNSAHESLIATWDYLKHYLYPGLLHFTCVKRSLEDLTTTEYLRDCAMQCNMQTELLFIDDLGWDGAHFIDLEERQIKNIFKLYPWELLVREEFGQLIMMDSNSPFWIEPPWKMILSNKSILPVLYELYAGHPCILPAYFEPPATGSFVRKPILGREGANVQIVRNHQIIEASEGEYGAEGFIYQALAELPSFENNYPLVGSWIIGQEAAGIGIREANSLITNNTSRFVPHYIT